MFDQLVNLISGAPWAYLIIFALAFLDAVIPLFPSETAVITGGVLAAEGKISLALVILVGAVGAVLGDNLAYLLGRHFREPIHRRFFKGEKAQKRIGWAERQLEERGGELIITARFIPGGRLVVTFSAGGLGFPWRRFIVFDVHRRDDLGHIRGAARLLRRLGLRAQHVEGAAARLRHRRRDHRRHRARPLAAQAPPTKLAR